MPQSPTSSDDLEGFLRTIDTRLQRLERHTHNFPVAAPPSPAPAPPFVPPTVPPGCGLYTDHFERADGAIGAGWVTRPVGPDFTEGPVQPFVIDGGAAVPTELNDGIMPRFTTEMYQADASSSTNQSAEVLVDVATLTSGLGSEVWVFTNANATDAACNRAFFGPVSGETSVTVYISVMDAAGNETEGWGGVYAPYTPIGGAVLFRLDSYSTGRQEVFINDELVVWYEAVSPAVGPHVGFGTEPYTSVRFESFSGGCIEGCVTFCDDFERADGGLGSNWAVYDSGIYDSAAFSIDDGAAVGISSPTGTWCAAHPVSAIVGNQSVEIEVSNIWQTPPIDLLQIELYAFANTSDAAAFYLFVAFGEDIADAIVVGSINKYRPDGSTYSPGGDNDFELELGSVSPSTAVTLRLEAEADGTARAYVNGALVASADISTDTIGPVPSGSFGAFGMWWMETGTAPRTEWACIGCLESATRSRKRRTAIRRMRRRILPADNITD
jgi:hypothetical protein